MANTISVLSTVAQAEGFQAEIVDSTLLGSRYFPNTAGDNFAGKEVLFDFDSADLAKGAFLTTGYKDGNTVSWIANSVVPPRVADVDSVDPKDLDRVLFERLCRAQGADLNRGQALQDLAVIKASRLAKRIDRAIEVLAGLILSEGKIEFDQDRDPVSGATDHIQVKFYDPSKGADNHFVCANAWNANGAHPYDDVCKMVNEMIKHGKRAEDLVLGANAWAALSSDSKFAQFAGATYHSEDMMLDFGEIDGAQHVARCVFNGVQLNVIVYSAGYKAVDGSMKQFIDPNAAILISSNIGRTLCGGVTLLRDSVNYDLEGSFMDMTGKYIEHLYKDFNAQKLYIRSESRPLPAPKHSVNEMGWIYCDTSLAITNGAVGVVYEGLSFECVNTSGQTVTPTTAPACAATVVLGGGNATITAAATSQKTYKYFPSIDGKKGTELTLDSATLKAIPVDCDRDADNKAIIIVEEQ